MNAKPFHNHNCNMKSRLWVAYRALLLLMAPSRAVVSPEIIENLIAWVISAEHGFWNAEKIEIRRANDGDYLGVFAKADISPNELLMQIPPERYIHIIGDALDTFGEEDVYMENYWRNVCKLATKVQGLIETSSNGYLDYLKEQSRGQLPVAWSEAGKERLRQILPPFNREDVLNWIDTKYDFCELQDKHWIAMTIQRGYDVALIPIWDMVNHDNGKVNVESSSYLDANGIRIWAKQPIQAGQEIYATYDLCTDCGDIAEYWGTTEVLRDFGFVEDFPQRWTWEHLGLWFEIHRDVHTGDLSVVWDDSNGVAPEFDEVDYYGPAKGESLDFLRQELSRLKSLELQGDCTAPAHECWFIQKYHESILTALPLAVEAAEEAAASKESCTPSESNQCIA